MTTTDPGDPGTADPIAGPEQWDLPESVAINAWTDDGPAAGSVDPAGARWGARREGIPASQAALPFERPVDPTNWAHPDVGYGILLRDPEDPAWSGADLASALDAEEPVRRLLAARPGSVVLRWSPTLAPGHLRRHFADDAPQDPRIGLSRFGVGRGCLPRYIAIVGGPDAIPWSVQYALSVRHAVGRIPLAGEGLGRYVEALLSGWAGSEVDAGAPLLWSVDHGGTDITHLMSAVLSTPLAAAMTGTLPRVRHLTGATATGPELLTALAASTPGLVVTSSHGRTGPLDDPDAMRQSLGQPIDAAFTPVDLAGLVAAMPAGAVWYAQACCSAGGDGVSHYTGLLTPGTPVHATLQAVAGLGASVAPAAMAMLGRDRPVRAVLGHVEPTFDWTLRVPRTGQRLGAEIVAALTSNAFTGEPLAHALREYRAGVGELHTQWAQRRTVLEGGDPSVREELTWLRLTALDRQALVLLGDPTVTIGNLTPELLGP